MEARHYGICSSGGEIQMVGSGAVLAKYVELLGGERPWWLQDERWYVLKCSGEYREYLTAEEMWAAENARVLDESASA